MKSHLPPAKKNLSFDSVASQRDTDKGAETFNLSEIALSHLNIEDLRGESITSEVKVAIVSPGGRVKTH